jgi:hypothetical protein
MSARPAESAGQTDALSALQENDAHQQYPHEGEEEREDHVVCSGQDHSYLNLNAIRVA